MSGHKVSRGVRKACWCGRVGAGCRLDCFAVSVGACDIIFPVISNDFSPACNKSALRMSLPVFLSSSLSPSSPPAVFPPYISTPASRRFDAGQQLLTVLPPSRPHARKTHILA